LNVPKSYRKKRSSSSHSEYVYKPMERKKKKPGIAREDDKNEMEQGKNRRGKKSEYKHKIEKVVKRTNSSNAAQALGFQ